MNLYIDCKHSSRSMSTGNLHCTLLPVSIDRTALVIERWARCDAERHSRHPAACGQMGKFFEHKEFE